SASLPWSATFAPSRVNSAAIAAPMPRELPVTNATLSFKRPILGSSSVTGRRHAGNGDRQQARGDALAARHAMAQSRPLGFAQSREFAQRRRDHRALYAGGEERAQRSDGEEMPWRPQRTMMKENPEQPTGCDRNRGGGHLRPEEKSCLI